MQTKDEDEKNWLIVSVDGYDGGVDDVDDDVEEMEREERHYPWVHAHKFHTPFTFVKTPLWSSSWGWWWSSLMIVTGMMIMMTVEVNISGAVWAKKCH